MKSSKWLLMCLFAVAYASSGSDAQIQQAVGSSFGSNPESASRMNLREQAVPKPSKPGRSAAPQGNLSSIKGGVVKEMRATSAFMQQQAAKTETVDAWLMVLAALGLVVLQLRRKHKSLPSRRIAPYG